MGKDENNYFCKVVSNGNGLLTRENNFGHGLGLLTMRSSQAGPSLKANYFEVGSRSISTDTYQIQSYKGKKFKGVMHSGQGSKRIVAGALAKIKPKPVDSFTHGIISSGQNSTHARREFIRNWASCSLQVSSSSKGPDSLSKGNQMAVLADIRFLFIKDLEVSDNTDRS